MKTKKELVAAFARNDEDKPQLAALLDKQDAAQNRGVPASSKFLSPEMQVIARRMLDHIKAEYITFGGSEGAERAVVCFLPEWADESWLKSDESPIAAIKATFKTERELSHRDFLGSLMGLGLQREAVGDIMIQDGCCYMAVLREVAPFVVQNMTSAGRVSLQLEQIALSAMPAREVRFETRRDSVMSMRLDGVVAAAFNLSRSTAEEMIKAGRVSLDHLECLKGDKTVASGSIISVRGLGKVQIEETGTTSRKGRMGIEVKKFV
ncbi:MAG: RNA-binding protein [Clostridia bacterium]|nr:RNA-binding protein [Clostridia bacterium]